MSQLILTSKDPNSVTAPSSGKVALFINSATNQFTSKDSGGNVTVYVPQPVGAEQHTQLVTVGQLNSGDSVLFEDIKLAIDSITDSSSSKPYCLLIYPGSYLVDPTTVPDWVRIVTLGEGTVVVTATSNVSPMFSLGSNCSLNFLFIHGGSNTACVYVSGGVTSSYVEDCVMLSGSKLIEAVGSGTQVFVEETKIEPGVSIGAYATTGAFLGMSSCFNRADIGAKCDAGEMAINNGYMGGLGSGIGVSSVNGGLIRTNSVSIAGRAQALHVAGGGHIDIIGGSLYLNALDVKQDDSSSKVTGQGVSMHTDRMSLANPANIKLQFQSSKVGDEAFKIYTDLAVGHAGKGRDTYLGEGSGYTNGRFVVDYDGVSLYTDVSSNLDEQDVLSHTMSTGQGSSIYIASSIHDGIDYVKILALTLVTNSALPSGASSDFVIEYWNGAWKKVDYMVKESSGKYLAYAETIFEHTNKVHVRFNNALLLDWIKSDPVGKTTQYYWIRVRTLNAVALQSNIKQLTVRGSTTEYGDDGFVGYFGLSRPTVRLPFDWGSVESANNSPSNKDTYLSTNLSVGRIENSFKNEALDISGLNTHLPFEIDTSCPIKVRWSVNCTTVGDVHWTIRWANSPDGMGVYDSSVNAPTTASTEQSVVVIQTITQVDVQNTFEVELDITNFIPDRLNGFGDMLWITLQRDSEQAQDTLAGDVHIIQLIPLYTKCAEGGHF